jgi:hypothetical protein
VISFPNGRRRIEKEDSIVASEMEDFSIGANDTGRFIKDNRVIVFNDSIYTKKVGVSVWDKENIVKSD